MKSRLIKATILVSFLVEAVAVRDFIANLTRMKSIPRSGWIGHSVSLQDVESVADHTFSTCALSMLLADLEMDRGLGVNVEHVMRMAVLHDLAEGLTFDISKEYLEYLGTKGQAIKRQIEASAWNHIAKGIKVPELANKYANLQREFDENQTNEAKIVHAADSMDILLQVIDYRRRGYPEALISDLWNERRKAVARSGIPSARDVLKMIVEESSKLNARGRVVR
jgi:putative hydrolase of HD superfamily